MNTRPILMSAPMVRSILANTKRQTRRVVKPVGSDGGFVLQDYGNGWWPYRSDDGESAVTSDGNETPHDCPYGQPGDRLWVKETFCRVDGQTMPWIETDYRATYKAGDRLGDTLGIKKRWTPSIFMPRHASRITLEVTGVRVERLQDISEADAVAEGIPAGEVSPPDAGRFAYRLLWESINGPGSWDANPWVWCVEFKRLEAST